MRQRVPKIPYDEKLAQVYKDRGYLANYKRWEKVGIPAFLADPSKVVCLNEYIRDEAEDTMFKVNAYQYIARRCAELATKYEKPYTDVKEAFKEYGQRSIFTTDKKPSDIAARIKTWFTEQGRRYEREKAKTL